MCGINPSRNSMHSQFHLFLYALSMLMVAGIILADLLCRDGQLDWQLEGCWLV